MSLGHILLVAVVVLLLFGTRRLPGMMRDFAKGYRAFMDGLKDDGATPDPIEKKEDPKV